MLRILGPVLFVLAGIGLDRLVKLWTLANLAGEPSRNLIPGLIQLTYVENRGAAFSIFEGQRWPLIVGTGLIILLLIIAIRKNFFPEGLTRWGGYCVVSGAVGNLIDRLVYGFVVDMLEFSFFTFPVFNIADVLICVGGGLWILYLIQEMIRDSRQRKKSTDGEEKKSDDA